jgi:hypothetical protein
MGTLIRMTGAEAEEKRERGKRGKKTEWRKKEVIRHVGLESLVIVRFHSSCVQLKVREIDKEADGFLPGSHALRGNPVFPTLCVGPGDAERRWQLVPTQSVGTRAFSLSRAR